MNKILAASTICSLLLISACNRQHPQPAEQAESQLSTPSKRETSIATRLIETGEAKVCNAEAVKARVIQTIINDWFPSGWSDAERSEFLSTSSLSLIQVTAVYIDQSVPIVSCEATFSAQQLDQAWEHRLAYSVRQQLDTSDVHVELDTAAGLSVLSATSQTYDVQVVRKRYAAMRDRDARAVCDQFMQGRGRWTNEELNQLVADMGEVYRRYDLTLGAEGAACDRLIRQDLWNGQQAASTARAQARQAEADARKTAEEEAERRVEFRDYTGPPPVIAGPPPPTPAQ